MTGRPPDGFGLDGFGLDGFGDADARRRRLREIRDVADELRRPVPAPDLTAAILARVEEERPFISERTRRLVWISRLAFAASLGVAALGIAMLHRTAPRLVQWTYQAQPVSDVVQTAKAEASTRYESIRTVFSSAGHLAAAGDLGLGRCSRPESEAPVVAAAAVWSESSDVALAPLPPSYSATYLSPSPVRSSRRSSSIDAAAGPGVAPPVLISTIQLGPWLAPRPLAADAQPSAVYWDSRLSTAPAASTSVPVLLERGEFGRLTFDRASGGGGLGAAAARSAGGAVLAPASERRVLDSLVPAPVGIGGGEMAVPR